MSPAPAALERSRLPHRDAISRKAYEAGGRQGHGEHQAPARSATKAPPLAPGAARPAVEPSAFSAIHPSRRRRPPRPAPPSGSRGRPRPPKAFGRALAGRRAGSRGGRARKPPFTPGPDRGAAGRRPCRLVELHLELRPRLGTAGCRRKRDPSWPIGGAARHGIGEASGSASRRPSRRLSENRPDPRTGTAAARCAWSGVAAVAVPGGFEPPTFGLGNLSTCRTGPDRQ